MVVGILAFSAVLGGLFLRVQSRFSLPDDAPTEAEHADYEVSGTDWLTLVEKFGLARYLITRG
jgi:hypothetical protein